MLTERPATPTSSIGGLYFCPEQQANTPSKDKLGSSVKITTCKTLEDLEGATEVELLNFPCLGALDSDSNEPSGLQRLSAALHPLRLPLQKGGISPRLWPDFQTTLSKREKSLVDTTTIILRASMIEDQTGHEKVVAMAMLTVPPSYKSNQRSWMNRVKSGIFDPVVDSVYSRLCDQYDGTDRSVEEVYRREIRKKRDEVLGGRDGFEL